MKSEIVNEKESQGLNEEKGTDGCSKGRRKKVVSAPPKKDI
jgi:hypothetical protein